MRYWLLVFLLAGTGCAQQGTYEETKHFFTAQRFVPKNQAGWVKPEVLEIHQLPTRADVHQACNDTSDGSKGSHFNILGLHWASIQDRGCYMYNPDHSVGHLFYLEGDVHALTHEKDHHVHGPAHSGRRPLWKGGRISYRESLRTGTRIRTAYGQGGI